MKRRNSNTYFALTQFKQELNQLRREQAHLFCKETERGLNEWEHSRFLTIPHEIRSAEQAVVRLSGALQFSHMPSIQQERNFDGGQYALPSNESSQQ
ncbi:MAG: hypothetical protein KDD60_06300 [Bdellovibrionales bacterium]|nr:hypothetical protein [Bdellovibrionales bacterium]